MTNISVQFVLKTPIKNIMTRAENIVVKTLNTKLKRAANIVKTKLPQLLINAIKESPEYWALSHNVSIEGRGQSSLYGEIGIPDIKERMDSIIEHWANNHEFDVKPFKYVGSMLQGGLTFRAIKADYSDVLSLPQAQSIVNSLSGHSTTLPWLEWLLIGGGGFIIRDYTYFQDPSVAQFSRTGTGIMISDPGGGWSIPQEYWGTQEDNFLTRKLDAELENIAKEIFDRLKKI
jgi:hypothetical protein